MRVRAGWVLLAAGLLHAIGGCARGQGEGDTSPSDKPTLAGRPAHHTGEGFRNPGIPALAQNRARFLLWQWERLWAGLPREVPGGWHPPVLTPDLEPFLAHGADPRIAWFGQDTFLLSIGGVLVMTDPHLTDRASPFSFIGPKRQVPLPARIEDLPHVDVVVISHNHYDHLDQTTVRRLNAQPGGAPRFLVPLGLKAWMAEAGIERVIELDWWQHAEVSGLTLHLVPAQHFSARTPFDTDRTLWGGWIVDHPSFRFYFAGDTGYGPLFKEIGRRFAPIDLAALPVGSYEPRWFMSTVHVDPEEAVRIHLDVGARRSVGMHWGTFQLTDEALDEPPRALAAALKEHGVSAEDFFLMQFGEARSLDARPAASFNSLGAMPPRRPASGARR